MSSTDNVASEGAHRVIWRLGCLLALSSSAGHKPFSKISFNALLPVDASGSQFPLPDGTSSGIIDPETSQTWPSSWQIAANLWFQAWPTDGSTDSMLHLL